jgi:histidyl-tRNA synthetase
MIKSWKSYSAVFFEFHVVLNGESICIGEGGRKKEGLDQCVSGSLDLFQIYAAFSKGQILAKEKINNRTVYFIAFEKEIHIEKALELHKKIKGTEVSLFSESLLSEQIQYAKEKGYQAVIVIKGKNNFALVDLTAQGKPDVTFKTDHDLLAHIKLS